MDSRDRKDDQNDLESPLGLAGTPITPDAPEHMRASNDPDEVRKRRDRAIGAEADTSAPATPGSGMSDVNLDHKGATGIDLGGHERGTK
jgi:hypothetical protein